MKTKMWKPGTYQRIKFGICRIVKIETSADIIAKSLLVRHPNVEFEYLYQDALNLAKRASEKLRTIFPKLPEGYTIKMSWWVFTQKPKNPLI